MEVLVNCRGDYRPDPELDDIAAVFYSVYHDVPADSGTRHSSGMICVDGDSFRQQARSSAPTTGMTSIHHW